MPVIMIISHVLDGISLGRMRGNESRSLRSNSRKSSKLCTTSQPHSECRLHRGLCYKQTRSFECLCKTLHQRDYVIIYTDVLELAYSFGESELAFVISHELAHIQCGHLKRKWIDFPAKLVPFLGQALSRAREYTCDRIAQELVPEGASMGLVALSAGTSSLEE